MTPFEQKEAIREAIEMSGASAGYCDRTMLESMVVSEWTPSRIDTAYGSITVGWARHPDPNPFADAEKAAAAIARACNSHHRLVEVLEAAEAHFVGIFTAICGGKGDVGRNFSDTDPVVQKIRAALSLAKGE